MCDLPGCKACGTRRWRERLAEKELARKMMGFAPDRREASSVEELDYLSLLQIKEWGGPDATERGWSLKRLINHLIYSYGTPVCGRVLPCRSID